MVGGVVSGAGDETPPPPPPPPYPAAIGKSAGMPEDDVVVLVVPVPGDDAIDCAALALPEATATSLRSARVLGPV